MGNENTSLQRAKEAKEDEFYTQLEDIERELKHYKKSFAGKIVYCNCDDPRISNFFHYFSYNFEKLRLKKLIATCYKNRDVDLFSQNASEEAVYLEYEGDRDGSLTPDLSEIEVNPLNGDGDFRSAESIELLKSADIVVTNPPFSLFREFIAQLMAYKKAFLILGNQNQVSSNDMQQLLADGKVWLGAYAGDMKFRVPEYYKPRKTRYWVDDNGQKWRSLGTGCWFTNLDYAKRHDELILYKTYSPESYPSYVNFDAIEVGTYKNIPADYPGFMGVPITALNKLSPEQFEIVGFSAALARPMGEVIEGQKGSGRFYLDLGSGQYKRMYDRVVVRNRKI